MSEDNKKIYQVSNVVNKSKTTNTNILETQNIGMTYVKNAIVNVQGMVFWTVIHKK